MYLFPAQKLSLAVALIYVKGIVKTSIFYLHENLKVAVLSSLLLFCFAPKLSIPCPCFSVSGKL